MHVFSDEMLLLLLVVLVGLLLVLLLVAGGLWLLMRFEAELLGRRRNACGGARGVNNNNVSNVK